MMPEPEPKAVKFELLKDILEAGRQEDGAAGMYTKMRAMITEVISISPLKLANTLNSVAQKTATELCYRAAEYVLKRIETKSGLSGEALASVVRETTDLFGEFLSELKTDIMREFVRIENFILTDVYIVDPELFAEGFIRFAHQEGTDYTRPEAAHALAGRVETREQEIEARLQEVQNFQGQIEDIDEIIAKVDELNDWLDAVMVPGIEATATKIREAAEEAQKGIALIRKRSI